MGRKKKVTKDVVGVNGKEKYSIKIKMGDFTTEGKGKTLLDAFEKIKMEKIIGKIQATFNNGKKEWTMFFLRPFLFRRALVNHSVRELIVKRAEMFLKK